ncbi:phosphatidylinositol 3-kinase catalytic subunit type 3-like [Diadema antillarum]|uniref:phosphatidylinositol 3-kinase catalytic subunit type 3-like n=1 Tax=Diadema antillarum TaxID=105358 RepID=UPI003A87D4F9
MAESEDRFHYVYSCDLSANVQIKIGTLEGKRERPSYRELLADPQLRFSGLYEEKCADLYVTCQVFADGKPLTLPRRTAYKAFTTRWNWNEWVTLPLKFSDLPRNAQATFTIWDVYGSNDARPVGGTTVSLFGKHGTFRNGMQDLKVWPGVEGDGATQSKTPGKLADHNDTMARLAKLTKKHRKGHMLKVDWLDRLTFREIEMINEKEKRDSNFMYLMVEFPRIHYNDIECAAVYYEKDAEETICTRNYAEIVSVPDPEMLMENLVESKHHTLARSERSGLSDRDLKPNASTRDQLNNIVGYGPTKPLTYEEQDLVWRLRFYLTSQGPALTKFLRCVKWDSSHEEKQALELLGQWSPIDVVDALELLSPQFRHRAVRRYAVSRLRQANDEELMLYLLQLVQALRYEDYDEIKATLEATAARPRSDVHMAPDYHVVRERASSHNTIPHPLAETPESPTPPVAPQDEGQDQAEAEECNLATFLIERACCNYTLANYLYWYLLVESDEQDTVSKENRIIDMYKSVLKCFSQALSKGGRECVHYRSLLVRQHTLTNHILNVMRQVAKENGNRKKKIERLQALLSDHDNLSVNFTNFDPLPLPLHPEVKVVGVIPEKASMFKSSLMPIKLTFKTTNNEEYVAICKNGDDLRQDQLILQIITLMDQLLRQENLDLKLTPYRVLATSSKNGFAQFIDSTAVADVLSQEGNIQNFFRKHAPSETAPYGISPDVMDTYVKSCAGYCVITYLLGVGDRHLDNLLLTKCGKLFHVDFGYILGRDPKPLPPPMKLSKEMVEGMGGAAGEQYQDFRKICYTSFLHLRRHSNLILNLFSLMVDASVPDIALEPDKTVKKLQDKFRLDLTDEEAVHYMQTLIDESVGAVFAAVVEQIHKFAQYWRK